MKSKMTVRKCKKSQAFSHCKIMKCHFPIEVFDLYVLSSAKKLKINLKKRLKFVPNIPRSDVLCLQ